MANAELRQGIIKSNINNTPSRHNAEAIVKGDWRQSVLQTRQEGVFIITFGIGFFPVKTIYLES